MALFKKKNEAEAQPGCCGGVSAEGMAEATRAAGEGGVKILGGGCKKCAQLEENTKAALARLGMDTEVEHVTDFAQIAAHGVMTTPALVVDGRVLVYGKVAKTDELVDLIQKARA